jgi:hypothetical protein
MKKMMLPVLILIFIFIGFGVSGNYAQEKIVKAEKAMAASKDALQKKVAIEFKNHCAVSGCHKGQFPKKKLNLEPDKFYDAIVDVPSLQIDSLKLVDSKSPKKSYLLMKIKGEKGIVEDRMPIDAPPMKAEEIEVIEKWIVSLKASETMETKPAPPSGVEKKTLDKIKKLKK